MALTLADSILHNVDGRKCDQKQLLSKKERLKISLFGC